MRDTENRSDNADGKHGDPISKSPIDAARNQNIPTQDINHATETEENGVTEKIGVGIVAVIVNAIVAGIYWGQLYEMRKATQAAVTSANAAETALRISESPDVQLIGVGCNAQNGPLRLDTEVHMMFMNSGKGTATRVRSWYTLGTIGGIPKPPFNPQWSTTIVGRGAPLHTTPTKVRDALDSRQLERVQVGLDMLHAWGWVSYGDKFGGHHLLVYDMTYVPRTPCDFRISAVASIP
jgi:hypothetical protein